MKVSTIKANYSRVVATVGLRRLTGHYSSLLFAPLFLVSCLALLAPSLLSQVLTPGLLPLLSLLVLVYKLWFRSTQVMLPSHWSNTQNTPKNLASQWSIPASSGAGGHPGH